MKAILFSTLFIITSCALNRSQPQRFIAGSSNCYKYFLNSKPNHWNRSKLKEYVAHPRDELRDGQFYERSHDNIVDLNNDLPVTAFAYFDSSDYKVIRKFEDWEKSAGIKLPNANSHIILTAEDINPDKTFHYFNPEQVMKVDSFSDSNVYFLNFESPKGFPIYREKLIAVDMLREKNPLDENMAMVFKFNEQTYALMDLNRISSLNKNHPYYETLQTIKESYFNFFLKVYNGRFHLDEDYISLLKDVSEQVKARTKTLLSLDHFTQFEGESASLLNNYEINGSFSFVISRHVNEPLPFELTKKLLKERRMGISAHQEISFQRDPRKIYAEFSRLSVDKNLNSLESTADLIKLAAASSKGYKIDEMLIYVDPAHKKLFKKFGFQEVEKYTDAFNKTFYIMQATPDTVLKHVMEFYHLLKHDPDEMINLQRTLD